MNISSSNKIQRNYMGLKVTLHAAVGQILKQKIQKDRKSPTAAFEEPGAKTGC